MKDFLKWLTRTSLIAVFWVFAFSINVKGRTVFSYANEVLVQNEIVRGIDVELENMWSKLYGTAVVTFDKISNDSEKM